MTYYPAFPLWHSIRIRFLTFCVAIILAFQLVIFLWTENGCFLSIEQRWENLRVSSFGIFYVSACASWLVDSEILLLPCCLCLAILSDPNLCIHLRKGPYKAPRRCSHFTSKPIPTPQASLKRSDDAGFSGCCAPFCILRASWKIPHWSCFFGVPALLLLRFHLRSPLLKWTRAWQAPKTMNGVHQNDPWTMPCLFAAPKPFKFNTKQCFNHYAIRYKGSKKQRFQRDIWKSLPCHHRAPP